MFPCHVFYFDANKPFTLEQQIDAAAQTVITQFDITQGQLFRVALFKAEQDWLLVMANHLLVDGYSLKRLMPLLADRYLQYQTSTQLPDMKLGMSIKQYVAWMMEKLNHQSIKHTLAYWLNSDAVIEAIDQIRPKLIQQVNSDEPYLYSGNHYSVCTLEFDEHNTRQITQFVSEVFDSTLEDVAPLLVSYAISDLLNINQIPVWMLDSGRDNTGAMDFSDLMGFITNHAIVVVEVDKEKTIDLWVKSTLQHLAAIMKNAADFSACYFGNLSSTVLSDAELNNIRRIPYPELHFNYLGKSSDETDNNDSRSLAGMHSDKNRLIESLSFLYGIKNDRLIFEIKYNQKLYSPEFITSIKESVSRVVSQCS